jgi:hypothetical protein
MRPPTNQAGACRDLATILDASSKATSLLVATRYWTLEKTRDLGQRREQITWRERGEGS